MNGYQTRNHVCNFAWLLLNMLGYPNDPKFPDRLVLANSADSDQTACGVAV